MFKLTDTNQPLSYNGSILEGESAVLGLLAGDPDADGKLVIEAAALDAMFFAPLIEACDAFLEVCIPLTEADDPNAEKHSKIKEKIEKIKKTLLSTNAKQVATIGFDVVDMINFVISLGAMSLVYVNPILAIVVSTLSIIMSAVRAAHFEKHKAEFFADYRTQVEKIRDGLVKLQSTVEKDSKKYKAIDKKIDRCAEMLTTLDEYEDFNKKKDANKKGKSVTEGADNVAMTEAVINFDMSDISVILRESDQNITDNISAYQICIKQALTENVGIVDDKIYTIMEAANETIGQKLLALLEKIKAWISARLKEIMVALDKFYENNLNVMAKVTAKVKERYAAGEYKEGPSASLYTYTLKNLRFGMANRIVNLALNGKGYNITGEYNEKNAADAKAVKTEDVKLAIIKDSYSGPEAGSITLANYKDVIHKGLRKDSNRHEVKFSTEYIKIAESGKEIKGGISSIFNGLIEEVDKMKSAVKSKVDTVSKGEDAKAKSGEIGFYNDKIRLLNAAIDMVISLNAIKLQAAIEQVNEAKRFCVKAYTYKTVKESAYETPYAFSLIESAILEADEEEESDDDDDKKKNDDDTDSEW